MAEPAIYDDNQDKRLVRFKADPEMYRAIQAEAVTLGVGTNEAAVALIRVALEKMKAVPSEVRDSYARSLKRQLAIDLRNIVGPALQTALKTAISELKAEYPLDPD
jgi:ABC-type amino acid transport substrate-binding protein